MKVAARYDLSKLGKIIGMTYLAEFNLQLIYFKTHIIQISVKDEEKDVWILYLDQKSYKEAYQIATQLQIEQANYIGQLYADQLFDSESFQEAAQQYFSTGLSFEQVVAKFMVNPNQSFEIQKGLEKYLQLWLDYYNQFNEQYQQQRYILIAWIVEIKLNLIKSQQQKLNILQMIRYESERFHDQFQIYSQKVTKAENLYKSLYVQFQKYLNELSGNLPDHLIQLIYQLMQSHDRFDLCIEFALKNKSFDLIITHFINQEMYQESVQNISSVLDKNKRNEILYKYFYLFMQKYPQKMIESLIDTAKPQEYDPTKLIGGLMSIPEQNYQDAIKFLKFCIDQLKSTDSTIHNALIFFLTQSPNDQLQKEYLDKQEKKEKINFDLDFGLRRFERTGQIVSLIRVYSMMGLYHEAIAIALKHDLVREAKNLANKPGNDEQKKKLQLQIAIHLLEKQGTNIQDVINLTQKSGGLNAQVEQNILVTQNQSLLKIEDLLPYFNENIRIEHFKDQICDSLESYNDEIEKLQKDMQGYAENADQLKQEIRQINNRYIEIDQNHKCEECTKNMLQEEFYVFPCMHGFHKSCLMQKTIEQQCEPQKYEQLKKLDKEIKILEERIQKYQKVPSEKQGGVGMVFQLIFNKGEDNTPSAQQIAKDEQELRDKKDKFDSLLIQECIYCGPKIVDQIQIPFELSEQEKESWKI